MGYIWVLLLDLLDYIGHSAISFYCCFRGGRRVQHLTLSFVVSNVCLPIMIENNKLFSLLTRLTFDLIIGRGHDYLTLDHLQGFKVFGAELVLERLK